MIAVAGAVIYLLARRGRRAHAARHRRRRPRTPAPGEQIVSVKRTSANDFDPLGDDEEHSEEAFRSPSTRTRARPGRPRATRTTRSTSRRASRASASTSTPSRRSTAARWRSRRRRPGWKMELYGATRAPARGRVARATSGRSSAAARSSKRKQRFKLDTGDRRYRYYLVWITALPPDEDQRRDHAADAVRAEVRALAGRARAPLGAVALERESPAGGRTACGHGTPVASQSFGNAEVGVMPGSVLSSLTSTRPPSSTKKSTRARPAQPTRRNVSTASRRTVAAAVVRDPRGHPQLDAAVGVLRLVVVPLGARRAGRPRRAPRPRPRRGPSPRTRPRCRR